MPPPLGKVFPFFVLKMVDTLKKKKGKEDKILTHPLVLVEDLEAFAAQIMADRGLDPSETDVIIGIDDGGNMLKVRHFYNFTELCPRYFIFEFEIVK